MIGVNRQALADELRQRSLWVYKRAEEAQQVGQSLSEDTVTEEVIIDLSRRFHPDLQIKRFSAREEGRNGADFHWEWWWEGATAWFGARVQAKRLQKRPNGSFGYSLDYRPRASGKRQVERLLEVSRVVNLPAIYVLYNTPDLDLSKFVWRCPSIPPYAPNMGVGLLAAEAAAWLVSHGVTEQGPVNDMAVPWSCLATCSTHRCLYPDPFLRPPPYWSRPQLYGFPSQTAKEDLALTAARAVTAARMKLWIDQGVTVPLSGDVVARGMLRPPNYVVDQGDGDLDAPADVAGVVVIRQGRTDT